MTGRSSGVRIVSSVLLLVIAGVGVGGAALLYQRAGTRSSVAPLRSLATPLLSARRVPAVLAGAVARETLAREIDEVLADPALTPALSQTCISVRVDGGTVVERNPKIGLLPASTLKSLTAAGVLSRLDPASRFVTEIRATTPPQNGVLSGDLWLVGGGDPLLETTAYTLTQQHEKEVATSFDALVDELVAGGLKTIEGRIVGDARRYDAVRTVTTWKRNYITDGEVGPIGGLSINDNFTVTNARGKIVGASDVERDAAALLRDMLVERGVTVVGEPSSTEGLAAAATAAPQVLASAKSVPLADVVGEMLRWSDNTTAEMLTKELGFVTTGTGSWPAGIEAMRATLAGQGIDVSALSTVDGSGLDRNNRLTCSLLERAVAAQGPKSSFDAGLAVMGATGTLERRGRDTPAVGKVRAKTGSLNGVSSLAGFADTADGGLATFALVFNGLASTGDGVRAGDAIANAIVAYPKTPPIERFAPRDLDRTGQEDAMSETPADPTQVS